jgi:hypothetical protein
VIHHSFFPAVFAYFSEQWTALCLGVASTTTWSAWLLLGFTMVLAVWMKPIDAWFKRLSAATALPVLKGNATPVALGVGAWAMGHAANASAGILSGPFCKAFRSVFDNDLVMVLAIAVFAFLLIKSLMDEGGLSEKSGYIKLVLVVLALINIETLAKALFGVGIAC